MPSTGLSSAEVEARRAKVGPNEFTAQETESRWHAFLRQYADAMQIVLLVAGILSIFPVKQVPTGVMLILLTVLNAYLGLSQEGKAAAAVAALQKMMVVKARVRRDGELREIPSQELVPGRHRLVRGRRPRDRGRPDHLGGHARDRRGGAHRREPAVLQGRRRRRRRTRRSATATAWPT